MRSSDSNHRSLLHCSCNRFPLFDKYRKSCRPHRVFDTNIKSGGVVSATSAPCGGPPVLSFRVNELGSCLKQFRKILNYTKNAQFMQRVPGWRVYKAPGKLTCSRSHRDYRRCFETRWRRRLVVAQDARFKVGELRRGESQQRHVGGGQRWGVGKARCPNGSGRQHINVSFLASTNA